MVSIHITQVALSVMDDEKVAGLMSRVLENTEVTATGEDPAGFWDRGIEQPVPNRRRCIRIPAHLVLPDLDAVETYTEKIKGEKDLGSLFSK